MRARAKRVRLKQFGWEQSDSTKQPRLVRITCGTSSIACSSSAPSVTPVQWSAVTTIRTGHHVSAVRRVVRAVGVGPRRRKPRCAHTRTAAVRAATTGWEKPRCAFVRADEWSRCVANAERSPRTSCREVRWSLAPRSTLTFDSRCGCELMFVVKRSGPTTATTSRCWRRTFERNCGLALRTGTRAWSADSPAG